jgi:hypothetical protein
VTVAATVAVAAWPVWLRAERAPPSATGAFDVTVDVSPSTAVTAPLDALVTPWVVPRTALPALPSTTGTEDVTVDVTVPTAWTAVPDAAATTPAAAGTTEPTRAPVVLRRAPPAPATTAVTAEAGFWPG